MAAALNNNSNLTASQIFIIDLIAANIVLAIFNLIPALPMDGGQDFQKHPCVEIRFSAGHVVGGNNRQSNSRAFYRPRVFTTTRGLR